ncbi:hypothetical protein Esti_005080 [Eimeria stiedai]
MGFKGAALKGGRAPEGGLKERSMKNKKHHRLLMGKKKGAPLREGPCEGETGGAGEAGGPRESCGGRLDKSLHPTSKKHHKDSCSSSSSNSSSFNSSNRKLPQWVVAALKAGEEAKGLAAAAAAARCSRPPLPNLTLALVGEVIAEQQQQQKKKQQQQKKKRQQQKALVSEKKVLPGLSGVECLDLSNRAVRTAEDLSALKQLGRVDLSDNCLTSLSFLSLNLSLHHIKAARNAISSVGPSLKELSNLRVLDLSDNKLQTMEGFDGLPNLKALILSGNEINGPREAKRGSDTRRQKETVRPQTDVSGRGRRASEKWFLSFLALLRTRALRRLSARPREPE